MRVLETHEIEAVTGGDGETLGIAPGSQPVYRYAAFGEVWYGDDPIATWAANQKYLAARDHAAANGIDLTRADFFEW